MRAGQPFSMRYPIVEVEGSYGTLLSSGSWSAPRYTSSRLSALGQYIFADLEKNVIGEWRDNYDNTEQYPMVLPSKGFYNLVNGNFGLGVGASSSIPQYNLKELNNALITLLQNPNCSFDDIYCAPDYATGATIINASEVKESHKNGTGAACKIRATVEWDTHEKCFVVTELPYMTYTETICKELEEIINGDNNPGIERFNDLTGEKPKLKIYLSKTANPSKVLKFLYKNTSLQTFYGINFTMLDNGRYPKVFGWKEMLQAHIDHEKEVYRKGFEYDLNKILHRILIINGLLKAIDMIDEVIATIKSSSSTKIANDALQKLLEISEEQAKAILDIKLARLAKLEVNKLKDEKEKLEKESIRIQTILNDVNLFNQELINGWKEVADKFGDARRTKISDIEKENEEPIEEKDYILNLTNKNNFFIKEASSLYTQRRGGVGEKIKTGKGEFITSSVTAKTSDTVLFFTTSGNCYHAKLSETQEFDKIAIESIIPIKSYESVCALTTLNNENKDMNIIIFTKKGMLKKSSLSVYNTSRATGLKAIELDKDDKICSVLLTNDKKIGVLTKQGQFMMCETSDVRPIGRTAHGVKGIKLNEGDEVVSVQIIPDDTKEIITITKQGYAKRTKIMECPTTKRYTKGIKIHKIKEFEDSLVDFLSLKDENTLIFVSNRAQLRTKIEEIPVLGRGTLGVRTIKLKDKDRIIGIFKI